jgi:LemA protein
MRASRIRLGARGLGVLASVWLSGCGYGTLQSQDARVETAWSEVVSEYRQRAALVPELINVVRGYVPQEHALLDGVADAAARARAIPVSPKLVDDAALLARFQTAQNDLSAALSRLVAISEKYPDLKSDQNFRDAESLLETSGERIAAARGRYEDTVREYNHTVRAFPEKLTASLLGFKSKADLAVSDLPVVVRPPETLEPPPPPAAAPPPTDPNAPTGGVANPPPASAPVPAEAAPDGQPGSAPQAPPSAPGELRDGGSGAQPGGAPQAPSAPGEPRDGASGAQPGSAPQTPSAPQASPSGEGART